MNAPADKPGMRAATPNPPTKSRYLPYEADFALLAKWRTIGTILLYVVSVISISIPVAAGPLKSQALLNETLAFLNYVLIIGFYVVSVVTEVFLYPATSRLRRINFIDNSLGSRFLGKDSQNYFSNDAIMPGPFKMAVNCFENCFFTYSVSRGMNPSIITRNAVFSLIFLSTAYFGIRGNLVALPIMQVLLSSLFITELIHHLNFVSKLKSLTERFKLFFMEIMEATNNKTDLKHPVLLLLEYETTLAFNKAPLSDRVYNKLKVQLSADWEELKRYYKIS